MGVPEPVVPMTRPGISARSDDIHRLAVVTLLIPLWVVLRPHSVMDLLTPQAETMLGRLILVAFLTGVLRVAWKVLGPMDVLPATPRRRAAFFGLVATTTLLYTTAAGAVVERSVPRVASTSAYGPLVPWPALEVPLIGDWSLRLGLGHMLVALVVALLVSVTFLRVLAPPRRACRRPVGAGSPALLLGATCPGCLPPLLLPLGALALPLAWITDPTAPASTLFIVAAPLLALYGLHRTIRTPTPVFRSTDVSGDLTLVALPLAYAGLPRGASPQQDGVHLVYILALVGALLLVGAVFIALFYYLIKYRAGRPDADRDIDKETGPVARRVLIALFLFIPAGIIFGIGIYSQTVVLDGMQEVPEDALEVDVTAAQFAWTFQYPDGDRSFDELTVPHGRGVVLNVTSRDVIHSLFIPEMGIKIDATPGRENHVVFQPLRSGTFQGRCAEHCGVGHTDMLFTLTVLDEGERPQR